MPHSHPWGAQPHGATLTLTLTPCHPSVPVPGWGGTGTQGPAQALCALGVPYASRHSLGASPHSLPQFPSPPPPQTPALSADALILQGRAALVLRRLEKRS